MNTLGWLVLWSTCGQYTIPERTATPPLVSEWLRQTGIKLQGTGAETVSSGSMASGANPFQVLDAGAAKFQGRWVPTGEGFRFQQGPAGPLDWPKPFFRSQLSSILSDYSFEEQSGKTTVRLHVSWHPELAPILIQAGVFRADSPSPPGEKKSADDWVSRPTAWIPLDQQWSTSLDIQGPFTPLKRGTLLWSRLGGEIRWIVPLRSGWVTLGSDQAEPNGPTEHKVGGTLIRKGAIRQTANRVSLEVAILPGPSEYTLESYQESALIGPAKISLLDGIVVPASGYTSLGSEQGWMKVRYDWVKKEGFPWERLSQGVFMVRVGDGFAEMAQKVTFSGVQVP